MTTTRERTDLLAAAEALAPRIRDLADEIDARRELPPELVAALCDAGLFWALIPRSLGGSELDWPAYVQIVRTIATADASTAWCLNQGTVFGTHSAYLDPAVARAIFTGPRIVLSNGPSPTAKAHAVPGGFRVTGRWTFSSGIRHATWVAGFAPIIEADGQPRLDRKGRQVFRYLIFPKEQAEVIDIWNVTGLRGTGSDHFAVTDLFVPEERTVWMATDPVREGGPLYVVPLVLLFASGFAMVAVGAAQGALDEFLDIAGAKTPRGDAATLRDQALVQMQVGQAQAHLLAARALVEHTVEEVWESVVATGEITLEQRARVRLATTHAIHLAAQSVDVIYQIAGISAIFQNTPLHRRFQDVHVVTQHVQARLSHYEQVGRVTLGLKADLQWM